MAYDRYDPERRTREDEGRDWRDRDRERGGTGFGRGDYERGRGEDYDRDYEEGRGGRGFFERMGDGVRSWFGDDRDDRQERDERGGRDRYRRDHDEHVRPDRWAATGERDYNRSYDEELGRGSRGFGRGHRDESLVDDDRGTQWDRDPYRSTTFAGSRARSNEDLHYQEWRRRQMEDLDRDYDDYRRECAERFESDFGGWRERRQSKREMLRDLREHMEVVGNDGKQVGTIDRIAGDRVILTPSDPDGGGAHHSLSCTDIDRVEDNRVLLDMPAERARDRWRDESRERALFEREDQGRAGPGVLNRSFSGTYR